MLINSFQIKKVFLYISFLFFQGVVNSFPDEATRTRFYVKYYQLLLHGQYPQKETKLCLVGPSDSGKTSWFCTFQGDCLIRTSSPASLLQKYSILMIFNLVYCSHFFQVSSRASTSRELWTTANSPPRSSTTRRRSSSWTSGRRTACRAKMPSASCKVCFPRYDILLCDMFASELFKN